MYIKMNEDKSLIVTVPTTIFRGEANADLITFLIPSKWEENNVADCSMLMRYILPDGTGRSEALIYQPESYKSYLQYSTPVNTRFTAQEGEITLWLTAFDMNDNVVLKSGELVITISPSKNITDYLPPEDLDQIDRIDAELAALKASKADDISFNPEDSTIQLQADGQAIGKRIAVAPPNIDGAASIERAEIDENGELVITYSDGTTENLGRVVGQNGAVYVPHVSAQKVLSFTVEDEPAEIPEPVDLNPNDEWSSVDGNEVRTSYVWETL